MTFYERDHDTDNDHQHIHHHHHHHRTHISRNAPYPGLSLSFRNAHTSLFATFRPRTLISIIVSRVLTGVPNVIESYNQPKVRPSSSRIVRIRPTSCRLVSVAEPKSLYPCLPLSFFQNSSFSGFS